MNITKFITCGHTQNIHGYDIVVILRAFNIFGFLCAFLFKQFFPSIIILILFCLESIFEIFLPKDLVIID